MNYLANYYIQSNYSNISDCINHYNSEDIQCKNAIVKNFLDKVNEDPDGLFNRVKKLQELYKDLEKKNKKLENDLKDSKRANLQSDMYGGMVFNGGIVKSPDEKFLLGLVVQPLDPKDKDKYKALSTRGDKRKDFQTINIMTNRNLRKQLGIISVLPQEMENDGYNTENDTMIGDYGIAFVGHNISKEPSSVYDITRNTQINIKTEGFDSDLKFPDKKETTTTGSQPNTDSFIDIPKKRNERVYVILFLLFVFLSWKIHSITYDLRH